MIRRHLIMNKRSLLEEFEITPKYNNTLDIKDYDIFPDKNLLDKLRNKIILIASILMFVICFGKYNDKKAISSSFCIV